MGIFEQILKKVKEMGRKHAIHTFYIRMNALNIHLFLKYLLYIHYVPGTSLDTVGEKQWTKQKKNYSTGGKYKKLVKI